MVGQVLLQLISVHLTYFFQSGEILFSSPWTGGAGKKWMEEGV